MVKVEKKYKDVTVKVQVYEIELTKDEAQLIRFSIDNIEKIETTDKDVAHAQEVLRNLRSAMTNAMYSR